MMETPGCPCCGETQADVVAENPHHTINAGPQKFTTRIRNVLCATCGLVYNDPMPTERELGDLYRAMARDVSQRSAAGALPPVLEIERAQAAFVRRGLADRESPVVLDIGCSMGGFLAAVAELGARAVGCDPSPFDAAIARQRPGVTVHEGFFEDIDFGADRFDVVSLRFVFEHVRHPRQILRRAAALLKPGGSLFIDVPNLAAPFVGFDDFFSYGHLQTFVPATLAAMCTREGLAMDVCEETDNLFESAPHPPSIRALLVLSGDALSGAVDVNRVRTLVERYQRDRESFMTAAAARLDSLTRGRRTVVYGAGTHTAELWARCPFLADRVVGFVDGNVRLQGHSFLGRPVHAPADLPSLDAAVVVVSVRTAEAPIRRALAGYGYGERTVTLYDAVAAGVR
jgi:2-polyprenyl-3-methyl-5-hydroxy-6-metoxy-1,4-benzoquinol methylase